MTAHMDDNGASLQPNDDDAPAFNFYRYATVCMIVATIFALAACHGELVPA